MKWRFLLRSCFPEIYRFIWNRCFQGSACGCIAGNYDPKLSGFTCCLAHYLLPSTLLVAKSDSLFPPPAPPHIFSEQLFSPLHFLGRKQPYLAHSVCQTNSLWPHPRYFWSNTAVFVSLSVCLSTNFPWDINLYWFAWSRACIRLRIAIIALRAKKTKTKFVVLLCVTAVFCGTWYPPVQCVGFQQWDIYELPPSLHSPQRSDT